MAFCKGRFSKETIQKLREDPHGIVFLSQPCEVCGTHVVAKNIAGEWVPENHQRPRRYHSGKSDGGKKFPK
jgi:hypothetical protein